MEDINKLKEFFLSRRAATTAYESVKEQSEDAIDTITMDVPLFIRMLEYAREDASQDMDLHDVTEKAISLNKEKGILSMEDYNDIVGAAEDIKEGMGNKVGDETFVSPGKNLKGSFKKDILDLLDFTYKGIEKKDAASVLKNIFTSVNTQAGGQNDEIDTLKIKPNTTPGKLEGDFYKEILDLLDFKYNGIEKKDAAEVLKNIFTSVNAEANRQSNIKEAENVGQYYIQVSGQDADKALEVWEQEYSTMGIQKVAANLYQGSEFSDVYDLYWDLLSNGVRVVETNVDRPDLEERITEVLDKINEELCPAGKAYIKRRKAAGEKSSAYLSGRAVKVCKGLMSGKKKKK
jgi:nucleoid DNA-binding protein